jgi:hypothetical protein
MVQTKTSALQPLAGRSEPGAPRWQDWRLRCASSRHFISRWCCRRTTRR